MQTAREVEAMIRANGEGIEWISTRIGSEPGQTSFGGGGETAQTVSMAITLVPRTERRASIWDMQKRWREGLLAIDGVHSFDVTEYGATPLSTSKAPLNLVIAGPDPKVLDGLADEVVALLEGVKGLTDVRRSWHLDKPEQVVAVDPDLARLHGLNPADVARTLKTAVKGAPASAMRLAGALDVPILVRYLPAQVGRLADLRDVLLPAPGGTVPLRALARVDTVYGAPFVTRENLVNTIDVTGINSGLTIAQVGAQVRERLQRLQLPASYEIKVSDSLEDMRQGGKEMGGALLIGVVLLYILLVWMYKSFVHPLTIMLSILIPVAAGMWGLLLFRKPLCQPAMMGLILLGGTVVNNAILLLDHILLARAGGASKDDAILEAVRLRFRPIVMTAASTAIGLSPLVFEMAVGMERMSPLGIVASIGLLVGIFGSTLLYPVIYSLADSAAAFFKPAPSKAPAAVALAILLAGGAARANGGTNAPPAMTREQAVAFALANSPLLQAAEADVGAARGNAVSARAGLFPHAELSANLLHSDQDHPVLPGLVPEQARFSDTTYDVGLNASLLLWDFGQTPNRIRAARAQVDAAGGVARRTAEEIAFLVASLFHQRLIVDDLLEAAQASLASLEALEQRLQRRLETGKAVRLDLLKVRVRRAATEREASRIETQRTLLQQRLHAALGYAGEPIAWIPPQELSHVGEAPDPDVLARKALDARADLQALEARLAVDEANEDALRRSRLPRIEAFGSYAQYGADDPYTALGALGNPDGGWEDNATLGVRLTLPLFDAGLRSGAITAAQARRRKAQAQRDELRLRIEQEVHAAVAELLYSHVAIRSLEQSVEEAALALRDEQKKHEAGKSTINDLLDAEAARLAAESQYRKALHERQIAIVQLQLALGDGPAPPRNATPDAAE
jgi:outer membrane protein TolC